MCELIRRAHIAGSVDPWVCRPQSVIDLDALAVEINTNDIEPQVFHVRYTSDCDQQLVDYFVVFTTVRLDWSGPWSHGVSVATSPDLINWSGQGYTGNGWSGGSRAVMIMSASEKGSPI